MRTYITSITDICGTKYRLKFFRHPTNIECLEHRTNLRRLRWVSKEAYDALKIITKEHDGWIESDHYFNVRRDYPLAMDLI